MPTIANHEIIEPLALDMTMSGRASSVVHLTSVHPRADTRIFWKECRSLAAAGYRVTLVVADGLPDEQRDGVSILGVPQTSPRLLRMLTAPRAILRKALDLDAELYHLHDPELLPIASTLLRHGKRVIFDAHEDLPKQILSKPYLIKPLRRLIAVAASRMEARICRRIDAVVAATTTLRDKFHRLAAHAIDLHNYPLLEELAARAPTLPSDPTRDTSLRVCYLGGITPLRGLRELVSAIAETTSPVRLALAGKYSDRGFADSLRTLAGWQRVDDLGWLDRGGVGRILQTSRIGLVTLLPTPSYREALPVKLFEYMAAGLPVIASHFPHWKAIVEGHDCGLCVDPANPSAIAQAIDWLLTHPADARRMGDNGRRAVQSCYNWQSEQSKLLGLYRELLGETAHVS
jgi:glycosyltransferase involved in cell wall biosynthesis